MRCLTGRPASPGRARGYSLTLRPTESVASRPAGDPAGEGLRLEEAISTAQTELATLAQRLEERGSRDEAEIFRVHAQLLGDAELVKEIRELIASGRPAEAAIHQALEEMARAMESLEEEVFRQRGADFRDLAQRLTAILAGRTATTELTGPTIIFARELTPSQTAELDPRFCRGLVTYAGGSNSHASIVARALGIPAVCGVDPGQFPPDGTPVVIDGSDGRVSLEPENRLWVEVGAGEGEGGYGSGDREPAHTVTGERVRVFANVAGPAEVAGAVEAGAEGIGLFRTEFLFMGRGDWPSEEEQYQAYRRAAEALGGRPLIIRTLDAGGDKTLPYLGVADQANPFLGWRAIRISLDRPQQLITQFRAILRASHHGDLRVMLPMVTTVDEVESARRLWDEVRAALAGEGVETGPIPFGIMIEVPAAALIADHLASRVDFFSFGTNDLTQYALAADRMSPLVADVYQPYHPAVWRLMKMACDAARQTGIEVGICGELGSDPRAIPLLVALGIDEISCRASALGAVKRAIRAVDSAIAAARLERALNASTAAELMALLD
ncbi:MAG: phosphoenolpyruvate--protein phosphotransferase [Bacillota bacterium]